MGASLAAEDVIWYAVRAFWDVPTPTLRAVAVAWDDRSIRSRFIYERPATEEEQDLAHQFGANLAADFPDLMVDEDIESLSAPRPLDLRDDEQWFFLRHEPSGASG